MFLGLLKRIWPADYRVYDALAADCNALGLPDLGRHVIGEMMDQKFIIDIDHMSRLMLDSVLDMANSRSPTYPLVSGHTTFLTRFTAEEKKVEFSPRSPTIIWRS